MAHLPGSSERRSAIQRFSPALLESLDAMRDVGFPSGGVARAERLLYFMAQAHDRSEKRVGFSTSEVLEWLGEPKTPKNHKEAASVLRGAGFVSKIGFDDPAEEAPRWKWIYDPALDPHRQRSGRGRPPQVIAHIRDEVEILKTVVEGIPLPRSKGRPPKVAIQWREYLKALMQRFKKHPTVASTGRHFALLLILDLPLVALLKPKSSDSRGRIIRLDDPLHEEKIAAAR